LHSYYIISKTIIKNFGNDSNCIGDLLVGVPIKLPVIYNLLMKLTTKADKNSQARMQDNQSTNDDEMHVSTAFSDTCVNG
jgi:hypothetical protein